MNLPVIIVGAGGHAGVVADCLLAAGERVLGFTDSNPERHGSSFCGLPVLGDDSVLARYSPGELVLANGIGTVGKPAADSRRRMLQERIAGQGWTFSSVRHPSALVSKFARIDAAVELFAACVVQPGAWLGDSCIINTAAVIEHDAVVESWVHVAPRAVVCGEVKIGARSHIGAGAIVRQGVRLGEDTVVGAGAVVVENFAGGGLILGVPARRAQRSS
jgi:sugar O-acyltransferase (sialic acid O-acetyltransferase NeuD family)